MTHSEIQRRIAEDDDYIAIKRFDYSLKRLLERYPEGCPNRVIAMGLAITEAEAEELYQSVVKKLRDLMEYNGNGESE